MVDEYWWQVKQANGLLMRLSQNTECYKMLMQVQVFGCIVLLMVFSPSEGLLCICSSVPDKKTYSRTCNQAASGAPDQFMTQYPIGKLLDFLVRPLTIILVTEVGLRLPVLDSDSICSKYAFDSIANLGLCPITNDDIKHICQGETLRRGE